MYIRTISWGTCSNICALQFEVDKSVDHDNERCLCESLAFEIRQLCAITWHVQNALTAYHCRWGPHIRSCTPDFSMHLSQPAPSRRTRWRIMRDVVARLKSSMNVLFFCFYVLFLHCSTRTLQTDQQRWRLHGNTSAVCVMCWHTPWPWKKPHGAPLPKTWLRPSFRLRGSTLNYIPQIYFRNTNWRTPLLRPKQPSRSRYLSSSRYRPY